MPKIRANNITMNYDQQGTGEPLVLIPYLAADYACYAFQVAEYSKRGWPQNTPIASSPCRCIADGFLHSLGRRQSSALCRWLSYLGGDPSYLGG